MFQLPTEITGWGSRRAKAEEKCARSGGDHVTPIRQYAARLLPAGSGSASRCMRLG